MESLRYLKLRRKKGAGFLKNVGKFARPFLMEFAKKGLPFVTSQLKEIGKSAIRQGGELLTEAALAGKKGGIKRGKGGNTFITPAPKKAKHSLKGGKKRKKKRVKKKAVIPPKKENL